MATVNEKMTAIANEVRTLSGTNDTMGLDAMATYVNDANNEIDSQEELLTQVANALQNKVGVSPIVEISKSDNVTTITITDVEGPKTATITDGESLTVSNVSESTVSGYNNVVTFSDGTTLTVKNGLPGENGYSIYSNSTEPMINPDGGLEYNSTDAELLDARTGDFVLCTSNYTLYKIIGETAEAFFVQALCNLKGADGVGIKSVTQTTTSTVDGGSNVVTVTKTDNATSTFTVKNGTKGSRGTGILKVTTAPSSYTTAVGGYTPKYRMALSTLKTQANVSEVLVGDVIQYSYYQYHIGYIDESYAYIANTRTSLRGAAGAAGTTPVKGTDYFTEADKTEMVNATKASMPTFTLVGTDVNDVTHTYILYGYNSGE